MMATPKRKLLSWFKDGSAKFGFFDPLLRDYYWSFIIQAFAGGLLIATCIYGFNFSLDFYDIKLAPNNHIRTFIVGSIAASTFLVFGAAHLGSSTPKKIFFGHFISALVGLLVLYSLHLLKIETNDSYGVDITSFLSISLAIFLMTILNLEHPPAAGTALAIATHNEQWHNLSNTGIPSVLIITLFILCVAAFLSFIRYAFYFDNDNLKAIEGFGSKIQALLTQKGITTTSDLCNEKKAKKVLQEILLKNDLYKSYCIEENRIDALIDAWITQASEITAHKKSRHILRDLF